jgi:hypothetical protein
MLAKRLARRGVAVSGATLAVVLSRHAVSAAVPTTVLSNTIKVASLVAAGEGAGAVSAQVATLTNEVLTTMSLQKLRTAALALLVAGLVLAGGLVTNHILGGPLDPFAYVNPPLPSTPPAQKPPPPEWRPDPALQTRLKTPFSFIYSPGEGFQPFHYTLKLPDGTRYYDALADNWTIQSGIQAKVPGYHPQTEWMGHGRVRYVLTNSFHIPGGAGLMVVVNVTSSEEHKGRPFGVLDRWALEAVLRQWQPPLEHGDIEEGIVNGSTFYRARVTSNRDRGYAYETYDGERAIYLLITMPNQDGFEDAEKLAEAVVLTWQKQNVFQPSPAKVDPGDKTMDKTR